MKEEIKTTTKDDQPAESRLELATLAFRCLANVCDKVDAAREKVILDSSLMTQVVAAIKDQSSCDKELVRDYCMASL